MLASSEGDIESRLDGFPRGFVKGRKRTCRLEYESVNIECCAGLFVARRCMFLLADNRLPAMPVSKK